MLDFNHIYKVLASSILETISPTRCVACDEPGSVLCEHCAAHLPHIDLAFACPRCGAPFGHALCTECPVPGSEAALLHPEKAFPFTRARSALSFEGGAKKVIRTYKDGDELRLDAVIASFICSAIRGRNETVAQGSCLFPQVRGMVGDWSQWADGLVSVPASPEALLRRGFDHMERVACIVARRTGLPLVRALASKKGALDQRDLGRGERLANRSESFALTSGVSSGAITLPRRTILIDDVFTTGATASAATRVLLDGGAQEVRVVTCCRVW